MSSVVLTLGYCAKNAFSLMNLFYKDIICVIDAIQGHTSAVNYVRLHWGRSA